MLFVAVVGTGTPVIKVHAHDDAAFGHGHDAHNHSHELTATPISEGGDEPGSAAGGALHAHADGCVAVGLTPSVQREISVPAFGRNWILRPASRPPDKPSRPLYRPPIA